MNTIKHDPLGDNISTLQLINHPKICEDLSPINAARQSFNTHHTEPTVRDYKLLQYLGQHRHTAPFRHLYFTWFVKAPISVARQWYKHVVGCGYTDLPWSEQSTRYKEVDEFYFPRVYREQSADNKQGSGGPLSADNQDNCKLEMELTTSICAGTYRRLLGYGLSREQARDILPLNTYTQWQWTASLQAMAHFVALRDDLHSQWEIRQYAIAMSEDIIKLLPHSWDAILQAERSSK